jgi:hypothetical protein
MMLEINDPRSEKVIRGPYYVTYLMRGAKGSGGYPLSCGNIPLQALPQVPISTKR